MRSQFSQAYLAFRALLDNDQLEMFHQVIKIQAHVTPFHPGIKENTLVAIDVPDVDPLFIVFVFRQGQLLSLLGGHWVREKEPTPEYLAEMNGLVSDLRKGRELR